MPAPELTPFEARITAVFLSAYWSLFLDFMAEHGIDELRCEDVVRSLENQSHG